MDNTRRQSILVVDDTPENLRLLAGILTEQGYRVRSAANGTRALATIQKEAPDLILLDIMMPVMDGFEVCRQLKNNEQTQNIPVIFISALDEVFDKMTAFSIGGVDFITKPFQIQEVVARVRTHLSIEDMRKTLQEKNAKLEEQNRDLDAYAHTVAHDLKNPLAKILTSINLVQEYTENLDEETQTLLRISVQASRNLDNIINELLLLASVRKEEIEIAPINNMEGMVSSAFARLSQLVDEYEPELIIPKEWPVVKGYAPWVEEVWTNYLSNALKYGGRPPVLELGATCLSNETVKFWVQDNGDGLTKEEQAKLFSEFTRLEHTRADGHGLGLSIVQRIIIKLNGTVGVESEPGHGSLFFFILPKA